MDRIKVIAVFHQASDPSLQAFNTLMHEIEQEFGDIIELNVLVANPELYEEYKLNSLPAVFVGDFVKFCGILPDYESLVSAFKETGLE